jgi:uncharacterized protein (TIGR03118 family)
LASRPLCLEHLEDRSLLSANVLQTNLVSDLPGVAQQLDPNLVNPWGISESPNSFFWISDNNANVASLYNTTGVPQSLVVQIPSPGDLTGASGTPTGTVFNTTLLTNSPGFMITNGDGTKSAPAIFLFATEDGTIVGWNPGIDPSGIDPTTAGKHGIIAVDNSAVPDPANGAVYKGLTIATDANGRTLLYAANFRSGQIDVFGTDFKPPTDLPAGAFQDPKLPKGYAPFDVQELGGKIYVTYAKQDADKHDDVAGQGHGFVDVYNLDGSGEKRLVTRGRLDSPWGLAIAPASFGSLAGALLVGNFGNGRINAYNAPTGHFMAALKDPDGEPIKIDGLWALKVGNGANGGDADKVYFTAGLFGETHGLFGSLAPVAKGTPEGPAEGQMVTAALDELQADLQVVVNDLATGVTGSTLHQDIQALDAAFNQFVKAEMQFNRDLRKEASSNAAKLASLPRLLPQADVRALDALFADFGRSLADFD